MNILKPKTAKTGKMEVLDPKLSKMAAPNFEPNSLCGPSTVFQGRWPNQGGTPQDPPKKRQFVAQAAFWSQKLPCGSYNWPFGSSTWPLGSYKWPFGRSKWPLGSLKMNILRPKTAKTGKMEVLDPKLSKMTAPNFGPNSLSGPSTVFQGSWSNQGGTPEDPPKKRQFVAQVAFWS